MKIHEYQAKELFRKYSIPTPEGGVAKTIEEAVLIAKTIKSYPLVIKAQIHAGGRGEGGGVKVVNSLTELKKTAEKIIGMTLVTPQTGPEGKVVGKVLVEKGLTIKKELYLSILPDRATAKIMIIASLEGGMNIEEVAAKTPEKIIKISVNPLTGIEPGHCRDIASGLKLSPALRTKISALSSNLYRLFVECDCTLVEINPLVITENEELIALDAKMTIDDNALFRHKDLEKYRDITEEDPVEAEAAKYNLNYISLDGTIGNMVNGAGLAMATMDIIKQAGANPANFLDVGGGADAEMIEKGFKIILSDKNVKGILINIFGGILRCDVLAKGVVQAAKKTGVPVPVVVRMEGTNVKKGTKILADSDLNLITALDLKDAAEKIAAIAKHP
ncbi:MAG: ADP-forming succinate--CoA ligase subunit beta [Desulfobulbaceae bacterium]|nr:ADP-forming succinate--CoA ligase subunit beta [Desulfobulbaceae bacterium]